jgi:hypothetical protein
MCLHRGMNDTRLAASSAYNCRVVIGLMVLIVAGLTLMRPASAQGRPPVDLELVLAVDISLSMDLDELRLQRDGYVAALRDPALHDIIARGRHKRIAVTYFEWAGPQVQKLIAPWALVDGPAAAERLAEIIERAPISRERFTSISAALAYADRLFQESPFRGLRRVVDVSGDGPNNAGRFVTVERDALAAQGIVINGLPVMMKTGSSAFDLRDLDIYYEDCVVSGPDAFIIPVRTLEELQPAIRRKLLQEIAGTPAAPSSGMVRVQAQAAPLPPSARPAPRIDCTIGEQLFRRYIER